MVQATYSQSLLPATAFLQPINLTHFLLPLNSAPFSCLVAPPLSSSLLTPPLSSTFYLPQHTQPLEDQVFQHLSLWGHLSLRPRVLPLGILRTWGLNNQGVSSQRWQWHPLPALGSARAVNKSVSALPAWSLPGFLTWRCPNSMKQETETAAHFKLECRHPEHHILLADHDQRPGKHVLFLH